MLQILDRFEDAMYNVEETSGSGRVSQSMKGFQLDSVTTTGRARAFGEVDRGFKTWRRGTHRCIAPEETLANLMPLVGEFGITRIANLTGLDRTGIPVVMVCRPNARSSAVFHGKGIDLAAAKASGLMEAIETWHAERVRLPLRFGSFADLSHSFRMVDVGRLPRSPAARFNAEAPTLWVEGRNLIDGESLWAPFEVIHADSTISGPPGIGCFGASTNGLASGNSLMEAASHALCELIERDATSLWRQDSGDAQDKTRLDLTTVADASCSEILELFEKAQIDVAVWDVTTEIGVPAFRCLAVDRTGEIGHVGTGAGCHPQREIALLRAMTEAAQVRTTYIVGSREDIDLADYLPATLAARNLRAQSLMRPVDHSRNFDSIASFAFDTFEAEVAWIVERLRGSHIREVVMVDLTSSEYGIPVVRVVAPGLEGSDHHSGYSPGERARAAQARRP
jgi:YcaO-like protein with predicted kinase domain